ncbi:MAG: RDD family protein, partial [Candidatus Baltobacteraceae bacterium]
NGNENPIVALVFGAWLRSCDFTCDKVGLLVCGSLDSATRAIAVASFHHFGRQVNTQQFAEQGREIARDGVLKWGEWLGAEPYATRRIAKMETFQRSQQYESAREWFLREHAVDPPELPSPGQRHVERTDCAGWWRRFAAAFIDLVIVAALVSAFLGGEPNAVQQPTSATVQTQGAASRAAGSSGVRKNLDTVTVNSFPNLLERLAAFWRLGGPIWLVAMCLAALAAPTIYFAVLVGLAGQTFGMMIVGLRVVTTDFRQPGFPRALWRYTLAYVLWWLILPLGVVMHRVMLHDLWSGTRLIAAERILARSFAPPRLA